MCQKREHRCEEYRRMQEEAVQEWCSAMELTDVLATWGRLGGRVTLHRYGREHFVAAGRKGGRKSRSPKSRR